MATYDSGVNPFMLYVKHVLMDALILNKHTKTINDAWIIKIEIEKYCKPVRVRGLDLGSLGFEQRMFMTPGNLLSTFGWKVLAETCWVLQFDFQKFEKFFDKIRTLSWARVSCCGW